MNYKDYVKEIPDFPKEGILFRDVTPLLQDGAAYKSAIKEMADYAKSRGAEIICGPEARGFLTGCPVATELEIGFFPVRKPHKLPRETVSVEYALEYGTNTLFMHKDAVKPGQKVVIVDDLLATGGTVAAAAKMIKELGAEVVGCAFLVELEGLNGRALLEGLDVYSLMKY